MKTSVPTPSSEAHSFFSHCYLTFQIIRVLPFESHATLPTFITISILLKLHKAHLRGRHLLFSITTFCPLNFYGRVVGGKPKKGVFYLALHCDMKFA